MIKDNEVTNKRLMKIFKDKTREFRETVYNLFGWRVDYTEERHEMIIHPAERYSAH